VNYYSLSLSFYALHVSLLYFAHFSRKNLEASVASYEILDILSAIGRALARTYTAVVLCIPRAPPP
jgi:hypothetical protein